MIALLGKSDFNAARNSSRGRSRNTCATRAREASSRSGASSGRGRSDTSIACTTSSSCIARERLATATLHLRRQILQRAQLQLLNGSRCFTESMRYLPYAPLFHKSFVNHLLLNLRKLPYQPEQLGAIFDGAHLGGLQSGINGGLWRVVPSKGDPPGALGGIDERGCRHPEQPGRQPDTTPLTTWPG